MNEYTFLLLENRIALISYVEQGLCSIKCANKFEGTLAELQCALHKVGFTFAELVENESSRRRFKTLQ